jgi:hypothetical protein
LEKTPQAKVPVFIWVVIVAILAAMYGYAAYWDPTRPEQTVKNFYHAYFQRDYSTVTSDLSVFWAVRLLPQYANMSSADLLANRTKIEKELRQIFSEVNSTSDTPKDISLEIMKPYTKEGTTSAIVVYKFKEKSKELGMEAAILIKEQGRFKIFTTTPVDEQSLSLIKAEDISELDTSFEKLLTSSK